MFTDNGIPYVMTNASTGEILPVFFLLHYMCNYITCETLIYYLYRNYICDIINYVHVENNSSCNSMNSTRFQNRKPQLS